MNACSIRHVSDEESFIDDGTCDKESIISVAQLFSDKDMVATKIKMNRKRLSSYVVQIEYNNILFLKRLQKAECDTELLRYENEQL